MSRKCISEATFVEGPLSTGKVPNPSPIICCLCGQPRKPSSWRLWSSCCKMRGLGQVRTRTLQLVSRSLSQGGNFWRWQMVRDGTAAPQRARPPLLSHRALSEERPQGLLSHRGLWQMLSSLLRMVSCSSSSPSRTAAARASQKYSAASWASYPHGMGAKQR